MKSDSNRDSGARKKRAGRRKVSQRRNDNLLDKVSILSVFIVLCTAIMLMIILNLQVKSIIGADFYNFHADLAAQYARGENALFSDLAIDVNGGPYPPLFHLMFALFLVISPPMALFFVYVFQVLFYPAILAATMYLVYKKMNIRAAAFTGVVMLSSIALLDRGMQVTPQAVDMILFPLAILLFLDGRKIAYVVTMVAMIYNHGIWAYLHFGALVLYSILTRKKIMYHVWAFVATLPLFVLTLWYLPGYFGSHVGGMHSRQEELAMSSLSYLAGYMGWIIVLLVCGYLCYLGYKLIRYRKFPYRLSPLERIAILWLLAMVPIFLFIRDRFASYAVPPIAIILGGWLVRELRERKYFIPALISLTIIAMLFILISWVNYFPTKDQLFIW